MVGDYTTSDFKLSAGVGGSGTIITDPAASQVVSGGSVAGFTPGTGLPDIALFANYLAASFAADLSPGTMTTADRTHAANPEPLLAHPHTG